MDDFSAITRTERVAVLLFAEWSFSLSAPNMYMRESCGLGMHRGDGRGASASEPGLRWN